jgi:hypothetical protein
MSSSAGTPAKPAEASDEPWDGPSGLAGTTRQRGARMAAAEAPGRAAALRAGSEGGGFLKVPPALLPPLLPGRTSCAALAGRDSMPLCAEGGAPVEAEGAAAEHAMGRRLC